MIVCRFVVCTWMKYQKKWQLNWLFTSLFDFFVVFRDPGDFNIGLLLMDFCYFLVTNSNKIIKVSTKLFCAFLYSCLNECVQENESLGSIPSYPQALHKNDKKGGQTEKSITINYLIFICSFMYKFHARANIIRNFSNFLDFP